MSVWIVDTQRNWIKIIKIECWSICLIPFVTYERQTNKDNDVCNKIYILIFWKIAFHWNELQIIIIYYQNAKTLLGFLPHTSAHTTDWDCDVCMYRSSLTFNDISLSLSHSEKKKKKKKRRRFDGEVMFRSIDTSPYFIHSLNQNNAARSRQLKWNFRNKLLNLATTQIN